MAAETTKLTIRLPKAQVEFAKRYAKRHGVTVTEVIARYLHALQTAGVEELSPETLRMAGILSPDLDIDAARYEYLMEKYK